MPHRIITTLIITLQASVALAYELEEFDIDSGQWHTTPAFIGRGTTPGWQVVTNDGEKAIRSSTTGTKATYYWRLSRVFDLTAAKDPVLETKVHFKGHNYSHFQIQVGPEGATRLAQFTVLYEQTESTGSAEHHAIPLGDYAGERVQIRFQLRKPYDVVESRIGLYVHRIGITTSVPTDRMTADPTLLSMAAFNIQVFGRTKIGKEGMPERLVKILQRYDLVLIQEIRDNSGTAIQSLLGYLNDATGGEYDMLLSERLGRTSSKEQYAYLYRPEKLTVLDVYTYDDGVEPDEDTFQREPYVARFSAASGFDFAVIGLHADPDEAPAELEALAGVFSELEAVHGESDAVLLGDFNAGCSYLSSTRMDELTLRADSRFTWWIEDSADTTTSNSSCPYDRIITTGDATPRALIGSETIYLFDQALQLGELDTRETSDHYPVEMKMAIN